MLTVSAYLANNSSFCVELTVVKTAPRMIEQVTPFKVLLPFIPVDTGC